VKRTGILALLGAAAMTPAPAAAQERAEPAFIDAATCYALPLGLEQAQRDLFCETATAVLEPEQRLERLNLAIGKLPAAHPANAMLQTGKAATLIELGRRGEALASIRKTMQAFPKLPPVWMGAIEAFAFTEHADAAADFWIELAGFNPVAARAIEEYYLLSLSPQLITMRQVAKQQELAAALDAIDYDGGSETSRSLLAEAQFYAAFNRGDMPAARVFLSRISNPRSLADVASDEALRAFRGDNPWEDAGRRAAILRKWIEGLGRAARSDGLQAGVFIRAIVDHVGPEVAIEAYEPVLRAQMAKGEAGVDSFDFTYWIAPIATAHLIAGQAERAEALYRDALAHFTTLDSPVRLNATSNYALFLQRQGRNTEAVPLIEQSIDELARAGGINAALLQMHAVRVLALEGLGRSGEAEPSLRLLQQNPRATLATYINVLLELGRVDQARRSVVAILESGDYMPAVRLFQPPLAAFVSPFDFRGDALLARLAEDRRVRRALAGKGRVLAYEPVRLEGVALPDLAPGLVPE